MNTLIHKLKNKELLSAPLVGYPAAVLNSTTAKQNLTNSQIQIDTLAKYYRRLQPDILFPFMDLSVEVESLGLLINIKENDPPEVIEHSIRNEENLAHLSLPDLNRHRFHIFVETIAGLKDKTKAAVSGYVTSPFTLAGLLTGAERIAARTITRPKFISNLIDFSCDVGLKYAFQQQKAGADCMVLLEPTASLLSPELFEQFVTPYINRFAEQLDIPVILHVCGNTEPLIKEFVKTQMDGLSLDYGVDLQKIMPQIPKDMLVLGNIDPVRTMLGSTPNIIYRKTQNLISDLKEYDNYIPATGCDVPPETDFENIEAFQKAVEDIRKARKSEKMENLRHN
ncbi:MAG TPA: uroporphyrinogen decarboxylase family protein [bacterium]|nr:uroporphyrinogen decarboxylase family protein [bacterium]